MATDAVPEGRAVSNRALVQRGVVAVVLSVVVNWLVLWGVLASDLVDPFDALALPPVTLLTALGAVGATVAYGVVVRRATRPDRTFVRLAAIVLLLSFVPDLALLRFDPAATVPAVVVLMILHVTVAVISVIALTDVLR